MPRLGAFSIGGTRGFASDLPFYMQTTLFIGSIGNWTQGGHDYPAYGYCKAGTWPNTSQGLTPGGGISQQPLQGLTLTAFVYVPTYPGGATVFIYFDGFDGPPLQTVNTYARTWMMGGITHNVTQEWIGFSSGGAMTIFGAISPAPTWTFLGTPGIYVPIMISTVQSAFTEAAAAGPILFTNNDQTIINNSGSAFVWAGAFGNASASTGRRYCEFTSNTGNDNSCGIVFDSWNPNAPVGGDAASAEWGYLSGGNVLHNANSTAYGPGYGNTDIVMMAADLDNHKLWFGLNGSWIVGDPNTGSGGITITSATNYHPACSIHQGQQHSSMSKFTTLRYRPPTAYAPW